MTKAGAQTIHIQLLGQARPVQYTPQLIKQHTPCAPQSPTPRVDTCSVTASADAKNDLAKQHVRGNRDGGLCAATPGNCALATNCTSHRQHPACLTLIYNRSSVFVKKITSRSDCLQLQQWGGVSPMQRCTQIVARVSCKLLLPTVLQNSQQTDAGTPPEMYT